MKGDGFETFTELVAVDGASGGKVNETFFLVFELAELSAEGVFLFLVGCLHAGECVAYFFSEIIEFA
ncbi:MAG: hypothetical protein ACK5LO_05500 [Leucobacter sp.]